MSATDEIYRYLCDHGPATKVAIALELGIPHKTVVHALRGMERYKRVKNIGTEKRTGPGGAPESLWSVSTSGAILAWLVEHGPAPTMAIAVEFGIETKNAKNLLDGMARSGRVERVGSHAREGAPGPMAVWAVSRSPAEQSIGVIESALRSRTELERAWQL